MQKNKFGFWSIVLLGINAIIGSGIFLLPNKAYALAGLVLAGRHPLRRAAGDVSGALLRRGQRPLPAQWRPVHLRACRLRQLRRL